MSKGITIDEAIQQGTNLSKHALTLFEAAYGQAVTAAFAGGLATGARNYIAEKHSARSAYDLMSGLADDVVGAIQKQA